MLMLASQVKTGLNWASLAKFLDSVPETTLISKIQQRVTVVQFSIKIKVEVSSEAISNHQSNTFPLSYLTSPSSLHSPTPSPPSPTPWKKQDCRVCAACSHFSDGGHLAIKPAATKSDTNIRLCSLWSVIVLPRYYQI